MSTPKLMDQVRDAIRTRHYSIRTEQTYLHWIKRYILFHGKKHPADIGEAEITAFLTYLAVDKHVAASTQNQALSAILFMYREVLKRELLRYGQIDRMVNIRNRNALAGGTLSACSGHQFCDASPGKRLRHSYRAGTVGAQRCENDHDLHARIEQGWQRGTQSAGRVAALIAMPDFAPARDDYKIETAAERRGGAQRDDLQAPARGRRPLPVTFNREISSCPRD